ncbi:hypothetical protein Tco_0818444 [Tanacetum coccineum]
MSVKMDDMTQQETLGTAKNIQVKINKFEFPCDFVVTEMPENLGEMIILGRPFLETIHAQIDVFHEEISLVIGEDRIKFDINGNPRQSNITIEKIYMENTGQEEESFNPLEIGQDLFSYESPACLQFKQVFYDDGSGEDYGMWPTCDPDSNFLQVRYGNQRIDDTTHERRYYGWVAQNYEFDNNRTPSTTTVSDKCPYKTNYPTPIPPDEWDTRFDEYKRVFDNEVENLSNEYTLRVGKKGYVLDDVWEKCEQYHKKVIDSWHDVGYEEEEELWQSGDEKTDYEPPFVDVKTFEVKSIPLKGDRVLYV